MKNAKTTRRHYLSVLLCTLSSALTGCLDAVVGDVDICTVQGKGYSLNESFPAPDGCNTCTCMAGGSSACTEKACLDDGGMSGDAGTCSYGGKTWQVGDVWSATDGCNTCSCVSDGNPGCSAIGCNTNGCTDFLMNSHSAGETFGRCGGCTCQPDGSSICLAVACPKASCKDEYGQRHAAGETFEEGNSCCTCGEDGSATCSDGPCPKSTCSFGGKTYKVGESFTDELGCNGCSCTSGGVACTARYCDPTQACALGDAKFASGNSVICPDGCNTCLCNNNSWTTTDIACNALQKVESCPTTPAGVEQVRILYREGDKLAVEVGNGGCATDTPAFKLCFDGTFRESYPVQVTLRLIPTALTPCSSVSQQKVFDLSPLRAAYQSGYQSQTGTISVSLDGTGFRYSF